MKIVGCFAFYLLLSCIDAKDQNPTKAETSTATTTVKLETKPTQTNVSNFRKNLKNTELNDTSTKQTTEVLDLKDFIKRVADIALTYDDKEFENFFVALDNELRNQDCKECTIHEISKSPDIQAFIISAFDEVKLSSTPNKRLFLKQVAAMMESSTLLDYLNPLHSNNTHRLTKFLQNLIQYKRNTTRSNKDIQSIIHNGFQSLVVDPYSNLSKTAKETLKQHLGSFFQPKEKKRSRHKNKSGHKKSQRTGKANINREGDSDIGNAHNSDETERLDDSYGAHVTKMRVSKNPVVTANDDEPGNLRKRNQKGTNNKVKRRRFFGLTFDSLEENISKQNEENFHESKLVPVDMVTSKSKHHKRKLKKKLKQNVAENENVRKEDDVDHTKESNRQKHKKNKSKKRHPETDKRKLKEIETESEKKREGKDLSSDELFHVTGSSKPKHKKNKSKKRHSKTDKHKFQEIGNEREEKDLNNDDLFGTTESKSHKNKKNKNKKGRSLRELKTLKTTTPNPLKNKPLEPETTTNSATFFITFDSRKSNYNVEKALNTETVTDPSDSSKVQSIDSITQQVTLISKDVEDTFETTGIQADEVTQHSQSVDVAIETAGVSNSTGKPLSKANTIGTTGA